MALERKHTFTNGTQANALHVNAELDNIVDYVNSGKAIATIPLGSIQKNMLAFTVPSYATEITVIDTANHYGSGTVEGALKEAFDFLKAKETQANALKTEITPYKTHKHPIADVTGLQGLLNDLTTWLGQLENRINNIQ